MCVLKEMEIDQKKNELLQHLLKDSKRKEQEEDEEVTKAMIDLKDQGAKP